MEKILEPRQTTTTNVLCTLPDSLVVSLQTEAKKENRSRHAQIIFILQKYFETPNGNGKKEKSK